MIYLITVRELNLEQSEFELSIKAFTGNPIGRGTLRIGEYIIQGNKLSIKFPEKNWLNEMEHELKMDDGIVQLQIRSHIMRDLETSSIHQMEKDIQEKQRIYYFYRVPSFLSDVSCIQTRSIFDDSSSNLN